MVAHAQAASRCGRIAAAEILREIEDSATGNRWLLERDANHPAGPGRLVLAGRGERTAGNGGQDGGQQGCSAIQPDPAVIHPGDPVVLVVHSAVMDAELEAVALAPAAVGSRFRARLKIGGKIVVAVALGAGKAEGNPESAARP